MGAGARAYAHANIYNISTRTRKAKKGLSRKPANITSRYKDKGEPTKNALGAFSSTQNKDIRESVGESISVRFGRSGALEVPP